MQALQEEIKTAHNVGGFGIIVADSLDRASIANLVKQARVVLATAGPFWKYVTRDVFLEN